MTVQSTIDKLIELHLKTMADAFRAQRNDPQMKDIPFEDRFGMLIDLEYAASDPVNFSWQPDLKETYA